MSKDGFEDFLDIDDLNLEIDADIDEEDDVFTGGLDFDSSSLIISDSNSFDDTEEAQEKEDEENDFLLDFLVQVFL